MISILKKLLVVIKLYLYTSFYWLLHISKRKCMTNLLLNVAKWTRIAQNHELENRVIRMWRFYFIFFSSIWAVRNPKSLSLIG